MEGDRSEPAALAETHSAVVVFLGDRAYKLKKPVDLGFLDFRTREARLAACRREVELNRRLAPDVYLGVADVVGPDGELCDHMVVMRRMPDDRRLSLLVASGAEVGDELARLAHVVARFHEQAERSALIDDAASRDAVAGRWQAHAAEMEPFRGRVLDPERLDRVSLQASRYLDGRARLFERRIAERRVCDGHGDLLADDVFCLDDGPRVLDCLDFDEGLRFGDVLADVAFLAMDLERLERPELAGVFLEEYRAASGDTWPGSLADHYVAYRAQVRAKVACLRWAQGDAASAEAAGRLLAMCDDHLRRACVRLVLVGGLPGSGKSTLAQAVAGPLDALVLRSDEIRKELAGVDPHAHTPSAPGQGLYRPAATRATYLELLARGRAALELGRTVVLDATWLDPGWREEAARVAGETSTDLVQIRCAVPLDLAERRVADRLATSDDPSDATPEIVRRLRDAAEGWTAATTVDTSGDVSTAVAAALEAIDGHPGPPA